MERLRRSTNFIVKIEHMSDVNPDELVNQLDREEFELIPLEDSPYAEGWDVE